jgi:hypothetical protein
MSADEQGDEQGCADSKEAGQDAYLVFAARKSSRQLLHCGFSVLVSGEGHDRSENARAR